MEERQHLHHGVSIAMVHCTNDVPQIGRWPGRKNAYIAVDVCRRGNRRFI